MNEDLQRIESTAARLSYESRDIGRLWCLVRGPYYQHNQLVRHARKLKLENTEPSPRYYGILPFGGGYNVTADAAAFVIWLLLLVYPLAGIGTACVCRNIVNVITAVTLAVLITCYVGCMWLASKNWKKLKRSWYVTKIAMKNYFGMQNRLTEVSMENIQQVDQLSKGQRQIILTKLNTEKRDSGRVLLMIVTDIYWKTKVLDPIISLCAMAVLNLVSLILQIELYKAEGVS